MRSAIESAARFRALYEARRERLNRPRRTRKRLHRMSREESRALRYDMASAIPWRLAISSRDLFDRLRSEWGTLNERTLWRALRDLKTRGVAHRLDDGYRRAA